MNKNNLRQSNEFKRSQLIRDCEEAKNYFLKCGFIDELKQDEKYYLEVLIEYFDLSIRCPQEPTNEQLKKIGFDSSILIDAITYMTTLAIPQSTKDKGFYFDRLSTFALYN